MQHPSQGTKQFFQLLLSPEITFPLAREREEEALPVEGPTRPEGTHSCSIRVDQDSVTFHGWLKGSLYSRPPRAYSKIKDSTTIKRKQWKLEKNWQLLPYNVQNAPSCLGKLACCSFVSENNLFSGDKNNKITLVKKLNATVMEHPLTKSFFAKESKPPFFTPSIMWFLKTSATSSHSFVSFYQCFSHHFRIIFLYLQDDIQQSHSTNMYLLLIFSKTYLSIGNNSKRTGCSNLRSLQSRATLDN